MGQIITIRKVANTSLEPIPQWNSVMSRRRSPLPHPLCLPSYFKGTYDLYCPPTVSSGSLPCWLIEHGLTSPPTQYRLSGRQFYTSRSNQVLKENKKAQLLLTNPHDAKACQNCSNSTCLQRCRWQYGYIFICLAFVASEMCEIPRNSLKIQTYRVQGHPRSSILVPIKSA